MELITEASVSTLSFLAGYLSGAADRQFGTGTAWSIRVYMRMEHATPTPEFVYNLEREIAAAWRNHCPEAGPPPSIRDALKTWSL